MSNTPKHPSASNRITTPPLILAFAVFFALILAACGSSTTPVPTATSAQAAVIQATPTSAPVQPTATLQPTPLPEPTATATAVPVESEPEQPVVKATVVEATATETAETTSPPETPTADLQNQPTQEPAPAETDSGDIDRQSNAIIIDHTAVNRFDAIPDDYIRKASQLSILFRHASVGANIDDGLNCLMNNFDGARPNYCDRKVPADQIVFDGKYNRSNWSFEVHNQPNPNPGWWNKVNFFTERVDTLGPDEAYNVAAFTFGYVDGYPGSAIDDKFFDNDPGDSLPSIENLEALEAANPEMAFVYWTMGLARRSEIETQNFNERMRIYAAANDKILFDLADIESHTPDGSPCFDNAGQGIEAICADYTNEVNAGHLNAVGRLRLVKTFWVLMARMAGWEG